MTRKILFKNFKSNSISLDDCQSLSMRTRKRKFVQEQADQFWSNYTKRLSESITQTEKEGLEKGYSSYQIENLWQERTKERVRKERESEDTKGTSKSG